MIWPLVLGAGIGLILCLTVSAITGLWPFGARSRWRDVLVIDDREG